MFCAWCGANNPDGTSVCSRCGKSLINTPPTLQGQSGVQPVASVPNYLVPSILVTVLCCLPPGIVAIVYSSRVNEKLRSGDILGAQAASKNAKLWCWIAAGIGILTTLVMIVGTIRTMNLD